MVLSVAMMLTMFPTGVLADDFDYDEGNTAGVTVSAEGQSDENQGEGSDTAQVNVVEGEGTQPETVQPENDQTEPEQNETDQAKPDQTETDQAKPEPGSTVPDQAGTQPDDKQPEPEQPATDPAENGVSDGAESTEGEQAESKTEFTVTWASEGETILTKTFAEGTSKDEVENAQPAETPVKEADGDVAYEFAGWTPDYADVTADQTYTATFKEAKPDEQDEMLNTASLVEPAAVKGSAIAVVGDTAKLTGSGEYYYYDSHSWTTNAPEIATVSKDASYGYQATVTGVKTGTATITHTWGYMGYGGSETFTVEVKETEPAIVYYLKSPTSDPNSNESDQWGETSYGTAEVNVASAPCDDGKNVFNPSQYVRSYSDGTTVTVDGVKRCRVTKETTVWNEIFNAYKQQIENQFNSGENGNQSTGNRLTITKDDVEYIDLVPYKISKNNGTNPDKHLDCTVVVKCNKIVTAKFWVIMPNGQPKQAYANNFRIGDSLSAPALSDTAYPGTMVYNGKTYVLDRGTWYTDQACTNAATLPTEITDDGEYQYYVKYKLLQTDISKLTVNAPADVTYIGKPQEQKPVVKDGDTVLTEGTDYTLSYSEDTTNVGTVTVTVTGKGNYSGETTVTYQIKPKAVTVKAENKSKVYGADDPNLTATVTGNLNGDVIAYTLSRKAGENVGTYTITPKGEEVQGNYTVTYKTGQLEITPAESLVVKITGNSESKPYTGENQSVTGYKTNAPEDVKVALKADKKAEATGKDVGKYPMNLKAKDFEATEHKNYKSVTFEIVKDGQLEITPVTAKVTVTITGNTDTVTYDGEEHTVTGYKVTEISNEQYTASDFTFTGNDTAKGTDVGTYNMGLKAADFQNTNTNFAKVTFVVATDGQLEITPVTNEVTVTITGHTGTRTYNGTEQQVIGYDVKTSNPEYTANDFTFSGTAEAKGTNAGTYQMGLSADQFTNTNTNFTNVKFEVEDGWLKIDATNAEVVVTITGNTKTVTYNGEEQSVEGYTATITKDPSKLYTLDNIQLTGTAKASRTDVGTTNMGLKAEQFKNTSKNFTNVTFVVAKDGWLKINPYMISIEPTETTFPYNGEEPKVKTDKIEIRNENDGKGLLLNHHVESIETEGSGVDAGTYEWFSGHNAKILDGNKDVTANYDIDYRAHTMTITPAPLKITTDSAEKTYDGSALTAGGKIEGVVERDKKDVKLNITGSQTNAGTSNNTYTIEWGTAKATNYKIDEDIGTLTINPREGVVVTITGNTDTVPYNGVEQSVEGYTVEFTKNPDNLYKVADFKLNGEAKAAGTDAGTYNMGFVATSFENTNPNFKNVVFNITDGWLKITPKEIVPGENNKDLTATAPEDVVYNGESQQQKPIVKDGDKVLEEGRDYTLTYSEDTTNAGTVTVTITGNGNYGSKFEVTYKITPASLKITTNSAEKTYDGSALTADGKIEGVVERDKNDVKLNITGSQTEVGESKNTYKIEWGTAKETNYKIAEEDIGTLKVNARSGGGSSSKPTPEEEPTPTPTPTPLPTLPTTPAPTTPARRVTRSTATVTEPASRPTEQITENETPKAESEPEVIEDEETPLAPMATGAWALVNLILMLLTVLASLLLLLGYLGKKKYAKEDEYGNALHDANGNEIIDYTRNKKGFWRVASLIPAVAAVIAFALTENMRLPMVMTDRWTLLMVIIAVVQLIVAVLCKKKKESEEDENQANA